MAPADSRKNLVLGLALAMCGSVLFSAKAIVVKLAYRYGVDPATLIAFRMAFAAPLFLLSYIISSRGQKPLPIIDHARLAAIGLIGYYGASYLDFLGLQYITAGLERLILYLNPTIVLVISVGLLGRKLIRSDWIALVVAYTGIALVFWHDVSFVGETVPLGAALVFTSAICYAIYLVWSGELVQRLGAIRLTSYAMLAATAGVFIQFIAVNPLNALQQPREVYELSLINGLLCTFLPVFATMLAVERIGAGTSSVAAMVGPVSTIILAWYFLDESVSAWQWIGTAFVLTGIYLLTTNRPVPVAAKGSLRSPT